MASREQILSAVAKTFLNEGIEGITMKKVAIEAGIGKSTLYEYFDSKESLISDTIIYTANQFIEDFYNKEWNRPDITFKVHLQESIKYLIQAFKSELGKFVSLIQESNTGNHNMAVQDAFKCELMKLGMKTFEYTKELIAKGQKEGVLRDDLLMMDMVNFERVFMIYCAGFSDKVPMIGILAKEVHDPISYVYDALIRLYGY